MISIQFKITSVLRQCNTLLAIMLVLFAPVQSGHADDNSDAGNILARMDAVRFPAESFQVTIDIHSSSDDPNQKYQYRVLSKGNEKSVVMVLSPAAERGQLVLMKGHDLWVFLPNVSQPVRLSLSQRLTGQVANGDLARANFTGDYEPRLLRTETIDGVLQHVLELKAKSRAVTYRRVIVWVRATNYWPMRAEFYSVSKRLLKTARYENFKTVLGRMRPTRLVLEDALKGEQSVLDYHDMKLRDLPDKVFTKDYLKKLN